MPVPLVAHFRERPSGEDQITSIDSDYSTLLDEETRQEVINQLRVPSGDLRRPMLGELRSSGGSDQPPMARAWKLSALDLNLPLAVTTASPESLEAKNLSGYQNLQKIRDEAAQFRRGYSDWRRGAARGARGEASFTDAHGSGLQGLAALEVQQQAPSQHSAPSLPSSRSRSRQSSRDLAGPAIAEDGTLLEVEMGVGGTPTTNLSDTLSAAGDDAADETALADEASGDWLRFAFNPFSEPAAPKGHALPLCAANLAAIGAAGSAAVLPAQGSREATAHIAHIGVGGFHRSHLAYVTDVLLQKQHAGEVKAAERWGIIGVGLMPWDQKMADVLAKQDGLYSLLLRGNAAASARVISSILEFIFVPADPAAALARLCSSSVRIVSLTVTEKGYYRRTDGTLDRAAPLVKQDIDEWGGARGLAQPRTAFGLICTILQRRRSAGLGPLTVLSCDNMPMNGSV